MVNRITYPTHVDSQGATVQYSYVSLLIGFPVCFVGFVLTWEDMPVRAFTHSYIHTVGVLSMWRKCSLACVPVDCLSCIYLGGYAYKSFHAPSHRVLTMRRKCNLAHVSL